MDRAGDIGEDLVDRDPLDKRREITLHVDSGITQPFVFIEVATNKPQFRTELACAPSGHATADAERLGFIRRGKHHATADGNWLAP